MSEIKTANSIEVHAIDESVVCHLFDEKDNKFGMLSFTVAEAEEIIEFLKEAVEEAKKSKFYTE